MSEPKVGVVSSNASLIVALSLQGHGFATFRVTDLSTLTLYDVVLVDMLPADTPEAVHAAMSEDVACVVIAAGPETVPGVRVVVRPYAMAKLVATLHEALRGHPSNSARATGIKEAEYPAPRSVANSGGPRSPAARHDDPTASSPEAGRRRRRRTVLRSMRGGLRAPSRRRQQDAGQPVKPPRTPAVSEGSTTSRKDAQSERTCSRAGSEAVAQELASSSNTRTPQARVESVDPIGRVEVTATALRALIDDAPFLGSARGFADGVARALAADLHAVNVGLWEPVGGELSLVGGFGLTPSERRMSPSARHPLLEQSRKAGGLVLEGADMGALVHGIPGARTNVFAVVLLADTSMPVTVVTVGADATSDDLVRRVESFLTETSAGWRAVQAVEQLRFSLSG